MQHAANFPLSGDSAVETYTSFSLRSTWFDNQFDIKALFDDYYLAMIQFRTAKKDGTLVKTMHNRNLVFPYDVDGVAWDDFGTLLVGVDNRVTIAMNARDTSELDAYDSLWFDQIVIPCQTELYTIVADPAAGFDEDNTAGRGEFYDNSGPGVARFIVLVNEVVPGDVLRVEDSTDNDGSYGVLGATLTHSVRQRVITLDGLLEGTAEANVEMHIRRLIPNWGGQTRMLEGIVEIDHGQTQPF